VTLARRLLAIKSRPLPLVAAAALALEVAAFLPLAPLAPAASGGAGPDAAGPASPSAPLHVAAAILAGLAFPGWYGRRGGEWGIAADPERSPALALEPVPLVGFTVPEVGRPATATATAGAAAAAAAVVGAGGAFGAVGAVLRPPLPAEERRARHRLGPLVAGMCLCFPVLGALAATVVAMVRRARPDAFGEVIRHYRELVDAAFPAIDLPPDVRDTAVQRTWAALELRPFVEIIGAQRAEDELAVSAIESTSALEYPVASRLLRHALASAIPETRYYAAKALARIEESLDRELKEAQEAHARRPDDPAPILRIADARLSYGEVGQADDPLNRFHLVEAIRCYRMSLDRVDPGLRDDCIARLAGACLKVGNAVEAKAYYVDLVDRGSSVPSVLRGCLEACFACGDYDALRRYLVVARERCPDSEAIREVSRAWLCEPTPPTSA
jgi:hypothetical protein